MICPRCNRFDELVEQLQESVWCIEAARIAIVEAGGLRTQGVIDEHLTISHALLAQVVRDEGS